ncbi:hypothetical protein JCM12296A_21790 [Desulfosarcina cetonica]
MNLRQTAPDKGVLPGGGRVEEGLVGRSDRAAGIYGHDRAAFLAAIVFRWALSSSVRVCVMVTFNNDGFVKSPISALRVSFVIAEYAKYTSFLRIRKP